MQFRVYRIALALAVLSVSTVMLRAGDDPASPGLHSLTRLRAGNAQFVAHPEAPLPVDAEARSALVAGQHPFAIIVSCADSRVPPELVFHTGLGDLFVVRVAGHVTDRAVLASVEYAVEHLAAPLVLIMGHEMCGAVKAALDTPAGADLGPNLAYLLKSIGPAAAAARTVPEQRRVRMAVMANVEETINRMLSDSAVLHEQVATGRLTMAGAYYELSTGRVHFSEPVSLPVAVVSERRSR